MNVCVQYIYVCVLLSRCAHVGGLQWRSSSLREPLQHGGGGVPQLRPEAAEAPTGPRCCLPPNGVVLEGGGGRMSGAVQTTKHADMTFPFLNLISLPFFCTIRNQMIVRPLPNSCMNWPHSTACRKEKKKCFYLFNLLLYQLYIICLMWFLLLLFYMAASSLWTMHFLFFLWRRISTQQLLNRTLFWPWFKIFSTVLFYFLTKGKSLLTVLNSLINARSFSLTFVTELNTIISIC